MVLDTWSPSGVNTGGVQILVWKSGVLAVVGWATVGGARVVNPGKLSKGFPPGWLLKGGMLGKVGGFALLLLLPPGNPKSGNGFPAPALPPPLLVGNPPGNPPPLIGGNPAPPPKTPPAPPLGRGVGRPGKLPNPPTPPLPPKTPPPVLPPNNPPLLPPPNPPPLVPPPNPPPLAPPPKLKRGGKPPKPGPKKPLLLTVVGTGLGAGVMGPTVGGGVPPAVSGISTTMSVSAWRLARWLLVSLAELWQQVVSSRLSQRAWVQGSRTCGENIKR